MKKRPDFLVCGGQRCGSTLMAMALDKHPRVFVAKPLNPEPKFFVDDESPEADFDWYLRNWFSDCGADQIAGEKSTSYLDTVGTAERIKNRLPSAKLIFILRHPIERAISNYLFSKSNGYEELPIDEAFLTESERLQTQFERISVHPHGYLQRSKYFDSLTAYFSKFSKDQLHFVLFEQLSADFDGTMGEAFRFLGLDPISNQDSIENIRQQDWSKIKLASGTLEYLLSHFQPYNRKLAELIGKDLTCWNAPTKKIEAATART